MKTISLNTTIKEIVKSNKTLEICNNESNNMFANPMLVQADAMTLERVSGLLGADGKAKMSKIIDKVNSILINLPNEDSVDSARIEINNSKGLEASTLEQERINNTRHSTSIKPGQVWYDTEGNRIQAHGACVYFEDGTYYWIGENKNHTTKEGEIWTWGVKIYSSKDLYNWTDEGFIIPPELEDNSSIFYPVRRLDRPHILYNQKTKKYVLWLKYCDNAHFAVLTCDSLKGEYKVVHEVYRPYDTDCGDFDLAVDEATGQGYLYWEVNHADVWGAKLSDDYTQVIGEHSTIYKDIKPPFTREAVTHMVRNGKHYIFTSGMTGYVPNPSEVAVSDDWLFGYTVQGDPHINDDSRSSFNSQISHIFKVNGVDKYIAIADRWVPEFVMTAKKYDVTVRAITSRYDKTVKVSAEEKQQLIDMPMMGTANTSIANYVWLPIEFDGDKAMIRWHDEWTV